jgi:hypothetical protein
VLRIRHEVKIGLESVQVENERRGVDVIDRHTGLGGRRLQHG